MLHKDEGVSAFSETDITSDADFFTARMGQMEFNVHSTKSLEFSTTGGEDFHSRIAKEFLEIMRSVVAEQQLGRLIRDEGA